MIKYSLYSLFIIHYSLFIIHFYKKEKNNYENDLNAYRVKYIYYTMTCETLDTNLDTIYLNEESEQDSCLVVCIEERDILDDYETIDTRVFISYNEVSNVYVINGKRDDIFSKKGKNKSNFQPFMFCANSSADVTDFLALTLNTKGKFSYTLFNYNNLSYDMSENTYEFMHQNMDNRYQIAAYDGVEYERKRFRQLIRMTKTMYN